MTIKHPDQDTAQVFLSPKAKIHESVQFGPFSIIHEDVEIGEGSKIGSNVVIHPGVSIGKNVTISSGTVISPEIRDLEFWNKDQASTSLNPKIIIHDCVHIEPSVTIRGGVSIQEGCWIGSNVTIFDGARIGKNCKIFPGAVLSGIPQDLKFHGEKTTLEIGENTTIRECATLNRGTDYLGKTIVGKNCLIMAYSHVAHDCVLGNNVILANAVNMAGHVVVGDFAIIGGMSAVHQFVKIGRHVILSGGSLVGKDVPPFVKAGRRYPVQYEGVNSIGLRRRGFDNETIHEIQNIYRKLFLSGMNNSKALDYIEAHLPPTEERDEVITFVRNASRGIIRGYSSSSTSSAESGTKEE